jgi:hypothetical protein
VLKVLIARLLLYVEFNCALPPEVYTIQHPVRLGWEALIKIEHYHVAADKILGGIILG